MDQSSRDHQTPSMAIKFLISTLRHFVEGETVVIRFTNEEGNIISEETVVLSQSPLEQITTSIVEGEGKGKGIPSFLNSLKTDNGYLVIVTF